MAVVYCDGQYLIGRRPSHVRQGGLWEFPGGKILPGETVEQAAMRECREETDLTVQALDCLRVVEQLYDGGADGSDQHPPYAVKISFIACRPVSLSAEPKSPFRWVAANELADYPFPAANTEIIRQLAQQA